MVFSKPGDSQVTVVNIRFRFTDQDMHINDASQLLSGCAKVQGIHTVYSNRWTIE